MMTGKNRGHSKTAPGKDPATSSEDIDRFRLRVVAELANAPPVARWPPEHLKRFQDLLLFFFSAALPSSRKLIAAEDATSYSVSRVTELKEWTESFLERWFIDGRAIIALSAEDLARRPLLIEFVRDTSGQGTIGAVKGAIDTVYALTVGALLTSAEGARLRRCGDSTCGNYFVKTGKMEYCDIKCGRRVNQREFRKANPSRKTRRRVTKR